MNPYDSPKTIGIDLSAKISPAIVERLIQGNETEDLVFYDVSDHQLFGRKNRMRLTGEIAILATEAWCDTIVYQSVVWWRIVFIPVVPLGVFAVIPKLECGDPDGDADQIAVFAWSGTGSKLDYNMASFSVLPRCSR